MSIDQAGIDWRHLELGDVSSTNDVCLEHGRAGEDAGLWVTADRQLGGRGRRGRTWVSEPGNLYASFLLVNPSAPELMGSLPLAVAVAVQQAIAKVVPDGAGNVQIKWPNDILINGAKVCGMLLEAEQVSSDRRIVVIGCGVNIAHHPDEAFYQSISINQVGASVSPQDVFAHLFEIMPKILKLWDQGRGILAICELWVENAAGIGNDIKVNLPNEIIYGRFMGLANDGNLILQQKDGKDLKIAAGDVFLQQ